jgi:hypothetical protein
LPGTAGIFYLINGNKQFKKILSFSKGGTKMNEQVNKNNEQNAANPQSTMKSSDSQPQKREIPKIKQGGCGCGKRRQL